MIPNLKNTELDDHSQLQESIIPVDAMQRAKHLNAPYVADSYSQITVNFLGLLS